MGVEQQLRLRKAQQKFRMRGLTLTVDALKAVVAFLDGFLEAEDEGLEQLLSEADKISLKNNVLSKESILEMVASISGSTTIERNVFKVIDAFQVPKFCYDPIRKMFHGPAEKLALHGDAQSKAALYRDRLQLLQQRIVRDRHFAKPAFRVDGSRSGTCEMTPLQSLIGCSGNRWVMGIISQLEDGCYYLEDISAATPIDLSVAKTTTGFFTENSIIVAEGELQPDGVFKVYTCGFPPLESRSVSLSITAGLDFFGAGVLSPDEILRLERMERKAINDMFVVFSEVWIDQEEKLGMVLDGFESVEVVPTLFVFMGNFCSRPCNLAFHAFSKLREQFNRLGSLIAAHPRINQESKFLFIPGPGDPGPASVLPRPPIPDYFAREVMKHVPNAIFSSNPCRVRYYSQEIVFFRQDLLYRMRRSCIIPPSEEETKDPFEHLVATVTHQSHLCPLPLMTEPISWNYDHSLRLYPTPHTIVLADCSEQKMFKYTGVTCFNPGSFTNDGTFVAYRPATQEPELSAI
ncbi:hypothetical protein O6H91_04G143500 [Diphasiastrum complanatum]|uniref:Uncharacterized protein n=1 Tax=Diphasiastrum complanatum TaxID=34168 RepID=A0ACC2E2L3_DIPCM|nr:hypothetical protein O6H91_04G143500 [Diphasiastrum complanatum]